MLFASFQWARTESNRRLTLIRSRLSPLSYEPNHVSEAGVEATEHGPWAWPERRAVASSIRASEVEGTRTPTVQIKSLLCCRYTTTPELVRCIRFNRCRDISGLLIVFFSSSPRRNRTFVSALSERRPEPLNDRAASVGMAGLEPTIPWSQTTWGAAPLHPEFCLSVKTVGFEPTICWPQPGAMPDFATF